jgi:exonuclease III
MAVNIATLNVNGLRDANKRMGFLHWLCYSSFDIVCLQEVHALSSDECSSWFQPFGFSSLISPGSNHSRGTVVLYKSYFSLTGSFCGIDGRFVSCDFTFRDKAFCVVSLYAPNINPDRDDFFSFVLSRVDPSVRNTRESKGEEIITIWIDIRGVKGHNAKGLVSKCEITRDETSVNAAK